MKRIRALALLGCCLSMALPVFAAGPHTLAHWDQTPVEWHVASDGKHGALAAWIIKEASGSWIGAQRLVFNGDLPWGPGGVRVDSSDSEKNDLQALPDGHGGAVLGWRETASGQTRYWIQDITFEGQPRWPGHGLAVATADGPGSGMAMAIQKNHLFVAWEESGLASLRVRCQSYDESGHLRWTDGLSVAYASGSLITPAVVPDRDGGFFVLWSSNEAGSEALVGQSINAAGKPVWPPEGMVVSARRYNPLIEGGAITDKRELVLVWQDRNPGIDSWGAQLLDLSGQRRWGADGITLNEANENQAHAAVALNDQGSFTLAWEDVQKGQRRIVAQQWNRRGQPVWSLGGIAMTRNVKAEQVNPSISADPATLFVLWSEKTDSGPALYAQRLNRDGQVAWESGVRVSIGGTDTVAPQGVPDGSGGVLALWVEPHGPGWKLQGFRIGGVEFSE